MIAAVAVHLLHAIGLAVAALVVATIIDWAAGRLVGATE